MKKILIGVLIILLVVMAYSVIVNGVSIGSFQILSVQQIQEANDNLEATIETTTKLVNSDYPSELEDLQDEIAELLEAKEEYEDLVNISTESEIAEATTQETYTLEYLWARIGSHATAEGVTLKLDITTGDSGTLYFTITGTYVAIINFITEIEDDSELGFRIEDFTMSAGGDSSSRQATFYVYNVKIEQELSSSTSSSSSSSSNTETTTDETDETDITDVTDTTEQ